MTSFHQDILTIFEKYSILTFILPFLLIFSLIFLLLEVTGLFKKGEDDVVGKKVHIILSLGFALTALGNKTVVFWMSALIPQATIWLLAIFLLILVLGLIFRENTKISSTYRGILSLIVISSILVIAANVLARRPGMFMDFIDYSLLASISAVIIIFSIIVAIAVWLSSGESSSESSSKSEK